MVNEGCDHGVAGCSSRKVLDTLGAPSGMVVAGWASCGPPWQVVDRCWLLSHQALPGQEGVRLLRSPIAPRACIEAEAGSSYAPCPTAAVGRAMRPWFASSSGLEHRP